MNNDSSTECWNQVKIGKWIDKSQTNDFRMFYIMLYTFLYRHRTLSDYIKAFIKNSFKLIDMNEPISAEEQSQMSSRVAWLEKIPMYLFIELEK